jgi:hypothetical protein
MMVLHLMNLGFPLLLALAAAMADSTASMSVGLVSLDDVLGLSVFGHLVKCDLVGIIEDDQVVKLLVGGEASRLSGNTLLEATISGKSENVVVEDLVVIGVVDGGSHLLGGSHTNGVGNTLSKRSSGSFNSRGVVLRTGEFGVTRGHRVVLTEIRHLLHRKVKSGKVEPGVKKHRSVSSREDETVTVDPCGVLGVVDHLREGRIQSENVTLAKKIYYHDSKHT